MPSLVPPRKLVFVAMPFGMKPDEGRLHTIDFDAVYERGIRPALARFALDCIRADEERGGGVVHLAMFERLLLAEIAIVDVTVENANVFYELGVRHAARPRATIIISGRSGALPFDIALIRTIRYRLQDGKLSDDAAAELSAALAERIAGAIKDLESPDSPLFQLIPSFPGIDLAPELTETFRDRTRYAGALAAEIAAQRASGDTGLVALNALAPTVLESGPNPDLVTALLAAYRSLDNEIGIDALVRFVEQLPAAFRNDHAGIGELYAYALNRRNQGRDRTLAIKVLRDLHARIGPTSESAGLLGRVYKDLYDDAKGAGDADMAHTYLIAAIEAYGAGFNADPRDYYPGVNLVTLLTIEGSEESQARVRQTLPAVVFAVGRLGGIGSDDYWIVASAFELAVLSNDWTTATRALGRMTLLADEQRKLHTTANNLYILREAAPRTIDAAQLDAVIARLPTPPARLAAAAVRRG